MNDHHLNVNVDILKRIKNFCFKIIIGEIFIRQYKKDNRTKVARIIDLFIPTTIANIVLFLFVFSYIHSLIISLAFCLLITFIFYKSIRIVKSIILYYLQDINDMKMKVKKIYNYINSLNEKELEDYSYGLLEKIDFSNFYQLRNFKNLRQNVRLKVILGSLDRHEELSIVNDYKNGILSSNDHYGIVILNYPANKELLKLIESFRNKSIVNLLVIDIHGLVNLAITHEVNDDLMISDNSKENQLKYNLDSFNQQLLYYKKKTFSHLAIAIFLGVIGSILDYFGSIYTILSLINIILVLISLHKYFEVINILMPGNIERKILTTLQR